MISHPPGGARVPGPPAPPLLAWRAHLLRFVGDPLTYMGALQRSYGDIAGLVAGHTRRVFAFGPRYNEQILRQPALFHHSGFTVEGPPDSALHRLGVGLFSLNGERHKQHRRLLMPAFQQRRAETYHAVITASTARMLDGWHPGEQRDLWQELLHLTQQVTASVLFGLDAEQAAEAAQAARLGILVDAWLRLSAHPALLLPRPSGLPGLPELHPWSGRPWLPAGLPPTPYRRLLALSEQLERALLALADRRRAALAGPDGALGDGDPDALSLLVRAHEAGADVLTTAELVGHLNTLFIGGYEAAHNALSWMLFLLSQHPAVAADLADEVRGVLRGAAPTVEQLQRLPLLDRVVKESLRLLPPVVYSSVVGTAPFTLGPYAFEAGTLVWYSQYITHHAPELYAQPRRFRPERWRTIAPSQYEYLPFDAGARACLGVHVATLLCKVALAMIVQRYRLVVPPGVCIDYRVGVTLAPRQGLPMRLLPWDRPISAPTVRGTIRALVELPDEHERPR